MLSHLKVRNFVYFKEEHSIDFQKGSNFFIGQNNAGKSSIFEAIRRCMSTSKNTSFSRPFDASIPSTVVAFFDCPGDKPGDKSTIKQRIVSSIVRMHKTKNDPDVPVGVKIVYFQNDIRNFKMDFVRGDPQWGLTNQQVDLSKEERDLIYDKIPKCSMNDFKTELFTDSILQEFITKKLKEFANVKISKEDAMVCETECEKMLIEYVNTNTVFMFSIRGIGSLQWSNSKMISNECRNMNSDEIQKHAEIINWYFDNPDEVDKDQEKRYFDIITNNSSVEFERDEGCKIIIRNRKRKADSTEELTLFKMPNGLFEAKNCAILLSMKNCKTIGIEEPERGMHPQMIERLRDLILQRITDKTIILTSHHPAILAPWTVPRIHLFHRNETKTEHTHEIIPGTVIQQYEGKEITEKKTPRIVTGNHFSSIFFAKRVLLVEGETDFLFVTSIKTLLLENVEIMKRLMKLNKECSDSDTNRSDAFLCSLHIVNMMGNENKLRLWRICEALRIEHYLLLDFDAILSPKPKAPGQTEEGPKTADKFLKDFSLSEKYPAPEVEGNVQILEKEGIFVWKKNGADEKGEVEDVIIALCKDSEERINFLKDNNVNLAFDRKAVAKKTKSKTKLFGDIQVTSENISNVVEKLIEYAEKDEKNKTGPSGGRKMQILSLVWFLLQTL